MVGLNYVLVAVLCLLTLAETAIAEENKKHHEYCVIGAGPGGLQIAYFLHNAGRDYIVYEKGAY